MNIRSASAASGGEALSKCEIETQYALRTRRVKGFGDRRGNATLGEDVVIARAGRPVARLTRLHKTTRKRRLGLLDGRFKIPEDFNRPLPEALVRAFDND